MTCSRCGHEVLFGEVFRDKHRCGEPLPCTWRSDLRHERGLPATPAPKKLRLRDMSANVWEGNCV